MSVGLSKTATISAVRDNKVFIIQNRVIVIGVEIHCKFMGNHI